MRLQTTALSFVLAAGCAAQPSDVNVIPPNGGFRPVSHVPAGGDLPTPFDAPDGFTFSGPTAPGSATFTNANVSAGGEASPSGTGSIDVTISGTDYSSTAFQTALLTGLTDPDNNEYIALGGYYTYATGSNEYVTQLFVIVKQSDFALNAPIALDGVDRVAIFGNGLATAQQPSINGAAIIGTVTFTAGSLTGTTVNANVSGAFGPITIIGGGSGSGSGSGSGTITAGSYALAYQGPSQVNCTGALVGHEADFSSITLADLAFVGGNVAVTTPSSSATDVAGSVIASAFGATPFELDAQSNSPGVYAAVTNGTGSGPDSTTFVGKYLAFDGADATPMFINASAGAGYVASDGTSTCTVSYGATLTAP